jgi:branched-chain amino acid transport system substrate-binding protein
MRFAPLSGMTSISRRGLLLRSAAAGIALLALGAASARAQDPIKIGLLLTYQGPTAIFARYEDKGVRFAVELANKAGGINGRPIEIVTYDTEGKPDRAGVLYRRLAEEDKVPVVIGPDSIFIALGMSAVPAQTKVLAVAGPGGYEFIAPKDRTHVVSVWASGGFANALVLAYFKDKLKVKRLGILTTADTIGQRTADEYAGVAKLVGIDIAKVVSQPASDRDLLPSLRDLAGLSPKIDAVAIYGSGPFGTIAVNQTELAGLDVPVAYAGGNIIPELIKDVGPDIGKRFYIATARAAVPGSLPKDDPYAQTVQKFVADYAAKYNEQPTLPAAVGYDMAATVIDALKAVGPDPEKIRDYVTSKQNNMLGVQGVRFNRNPQDGYGVDPRDHVIASIEGGKFVFKAYLPQSFKNLGIKDDAFLALMREHKMLID